MTDHLPPSTGATMPPPAGDLPPEPAPGDQTVPVPQPTPPMLPPPGPPPGYASAPSYGSAAPTPAAPGSPFAAPAPGSPFMAPPGSPYPPSAPVPVSGRNGLAIAALCCGIAGIIPVAAVVGIVLGAVALGQLRRRVQKGKVMAVVGIVLGVLWLAGWVALIVSAANDAPPRTASGSVTASTDAYVEDLKAGDCFSGAGREEVDSLTIVPCTSAHESQVVTTFTLPAGAWPGKDKVVADAEKGCTDKGDPLVTDRAFATQRPSFIYPQDAYSWRSSREIICLVEPEKGTTTGSALK
ncbi:DUF4190 domain-containing protein [Terrabacter aerolatus]|uniref:DUF4190 domain-containing protein n=1 Tax=Terrabacter aerolatus TaxID=422442 RepID=UPI001649FFF7|nr:DUF4190 domain-containing protein [Terrabacter aerolatus]